MDRSTDVRWIVAVIDRPFPRLREAVDFWAAVSGTTARPPKHERFVELRHARADDWLLVQGVLDGPGSVHLDLSVDDMAAVSRRAVALGATLTGDHGSWRVLTSPAGWPFCVAAWKGEHRRPAPFRRPDGGLSRVHQVCLDLAPSVFDAEVAFWAALTGWPVDAGDLPTFSRLRSPGHLPLRLLLQRLGEERGTTAHLDVACAAIPAAQAWHEELGATAAGVWPHWTTLRDPTGTLYCLTDSDPES